MSNTYTSTTDDLRSSQRQSESIQQPEYATNSPSEYNTSSAYSSTMLGDSSLGGWGNSSARAAVMQSAQATYGNRAVQRSLGQIESMSTANDVTVQRSSAPESTSGGTATSQSGGGSQWLGGGMWLTPGETEVGGWGHPKGGTGAFGYYEDTPYQLTLPGLPDPTLHSFQGGFGMDIGGTTVLGGSANGGTWTDDEGGTRVGGKFNAGLLPSGEMGGVDGQLLSVGGEASIGNDGFTLGGGVTVGGAGVTTGDKFDPNSNTDDSAHFGLSEGPSLGVRGHWGDSDGDGYGEYGFGFDAGFVSFDAKSEDPLRTMLSGGPLNMLPDSWNPMNALLPEKGNLTGEAIGMAGSAMDTMAGGVKSALDWASPMWMGDSGGLEPTSPPADGGGGLFEDFPTF